MNKVFFLSAALVISTSALADQKTPIAPSLPTHVGTDIMGNQVIHNAPAQAESTADTNTDQVKTSHRSKKKRRSK